MLRVGFQMDPLDNIDPLSDTSFRLAEEAQNRGYSVFHYLPDELTYSRKKIFVNKYLFKNKSRINFQKITVNKVIKTVLSIVK